MRKKLFLIPIQIFIFILCLFSLKASAQLSDSTLIQFSGVVVSADSLKPIPFVNIFIKDSWRGTITDLYGFFSFVAHKNDVVVFNALGCKTTYYRIPDTIRSSRYSLIQVMSADTLIMNETVIYPWPTYEQFKQAFVDLQIKDDELARADKNIAEIKKRIRLDVGGMDASMNFRNAIGNHINQLYTAGQYPVNNLLSPVAWAQFIKAWKDGKFKNKKQEE